MSSFAWPASPVMLAVALIYRAPQIDAMGA